MLTLTNALQVFAATAHVFTVSALKPLVITKQPQSQIVTQEATARLSVTVAGFPPFQYQWNKDGETLQGATNSTLTITNFQTTNAGAYDVVVCNRAGCTTSANATLNMFGSPVITSFAPSNGPVRTVATILGKNFGANPSNNVVRFGATRASVISAATNRLVVSVPVGATYAPPSVTINGATATAAYPFDVTFRSTGVFNSSSFASPVTINVRPLNGSMAVADLDGDGKADYVICSLDASGTILTILRNIGTNGTLTAGSFAPRVDLSLVPGSSTSASAVAVADVDGDGRPDLIVTCRDIGVVSVFRNLSSPGSLSSTSFAARVDFPTAYAPEGLKIGDIDGDGKLDIVVANYGNDTGNTISVFRNTGAPGTVSFAARKDFTVGGAPYNIALGDVDGDGKLDVIAPGYDTGVVSILRNTSTSGLVSFASKVDFATGSTPVGVNLYDLDADGKPDLFVANYSSATISVFKNRSTPGRIVFATKFDIPTATGGSPHSVAIADLDGDGKPDMVTETELPDGVIVYRNIGTRGDLAAGSFATPVIFEAGWNPWISTVGDMDGDGKPDLFVANDYGETVSLFRNMMAGPQSAIVTQPQSETSQVDAIASVSAGATGASPLGAPKVPSGLSDGLIAYYPFNGDATDQSGNGNNGNSTNVVFNTDRFGNPNSSADFSSNGFVEIPTLDAMPYYPVTYSAWFKLNRYWLPSEQRPGDEWSDMTLVGRDTPGNTTEGAVCFQYQLGGGPSNIVYYSGGNTFSTGQCPPTNQWIQVVFTLDASNNAAFYWNGQLIESATFIATQNAALPFRIGASASLSSYRTSWKGSIDDVRVYNRALSSDDVSQLYVSEAPPVPSLAISQDGLGNVIVMWPASADGYGLESVSDLSANWQPVSGNIVTNGANIFLTQPVATNQLYFRLRHP